MNENDRNRDVQNSVIDGVLSTQSELGPKIPDGGYGWVVFAATLFFQLLVPCLILVYGVLLSASKLNTGIDDTEILYFWDDKLIYVPLIFTISWTAFDPTARNLISHSTWPRLVGQAGNCLTCAGFLFVWMGMAGKEDTMISNKIWLILAGFLSGIGSSIQVAQCEVLLAQYFKSKHLYLTHITHMIVGLGFLISPILISYLRLKFDLLHVVLIYQAILLQGVVINIAFKKPEYLKSRRIQYHYVMENAEEEEDIFSKSLTELKVKTKDVLKRIELKSDNRESQASPSTSYARRDYENDISRKDWVEFNNDEQKSEVKSWERFEDESEDRKDNLKNNTIDNTESVTSNDDNLNRDVPVSIFNDTRVNMNTTYSFDEDNIEYGPKSVPTVFAESEKAPTFNIAVYLKILKMPTFYKSLLTNITTKYSVFLFYVLFPSYFYVQISHLRFKKSALLIGCLSIGTIIFSGFSYWINVNKQKRPLVLFVLCWIGACGYFLIATFKHSEYIVMFGAMEIVLSIASLQHIGGPLLGLTIRGESNSEYVALSLMTGLSFLLFLLIDISYTDCFFMMALLQVITGLLWVSNYFYKRLHIF